MKTPKLSAVCSVENVDKISLLKTLKSQNIEVFELFEENNRLYITIDYKQCKKIFAISDNMCYNIRCIKLKGVLSPVFSTVKNLGKITGAVLLALLMFLSDGFIGEIQYLGDSEKIKSEIDSLLSSENVGKYKPADYNYNLLSDKIFTCIQGVTFSSVEKKGRTLKILTYVKSNGVKRVAEKKSSLVSPYDGEVLNADVLCGKAKVKIGDNVKRGDLLISGEYTFSGEEKHSYVLGEVTLKLKKTFYFESEKDEKLKNGYLSFINETFDLGDIYATDEVYEDGKYIINVYYLRLVS